MGRIEHIKMTLTNASKVKIKLNIPNYGVYRTELTNQEFENITSHLLDKTGVLCQDVLDELHYTWNDITDILLVGGSTRMPQVSKYLEKISGHKPITQVHPDEAVVLGAAINLYYRFQNIMFYLLLQNQSQIKCNSAKGKTSNKCFSYEIK